MQESQRNLAHRQKRAAMASTYGTLVTSSRAATADALSRMGRGIAGIGDLEFI
jgi:hypothetical protein